MTTPATARESKAQAQQSLNEWSQERVDDAMFWAMFIFPSAPEKLREDYERACKLEAENLEYLQSRHTGYHGSFNPIGFTEAEQNILNHFSKRTTETRKAILEDYQAKLEQG